MYLLSVFMYVYIHVGMSVCIHTHMEAKEQAQ